MTARQPGHLTRLRIPSATKESNSLNPSNVRMPMFIGDCSRNEVYSRCRKNASNRATP
jgi:hypothetical protein